MTIGIYKLEFSNSYFYIGQSINIEARHKNHLAKLRANTHDNELMQDVFNTVGAPEMHILEVCIIGELDAKEKYYIASTNATVKGLNKLKGATSILYGEDTSRAVHSNDLITKIFKDIVHTDISLAQLCRNHAVPNGTAQAIANSQNHTWLSEAFPDDYCVMVRKQGTRDSFATAASQGITYPKVVSPDGEIYEVTNLNKFAREHGINPSCLHKLLHKKTLARKGWKLAA